MTTIYTGKLFWNNKSPIGGVEVRLYEPGNGLQLGTELTITPGYSQLDGSFTIEIKDSKFIDNSALSDLEGLSQEFFSIFTLGQGLGAEVRPIIQFTYSVCNQIILDRLPFRKLHRGYLLSHNPPVNFIPSKDGFIFENNFKPFDLPFTIPEWLGVNRISDGYGLCGGMSSAAYDFCLARTPDPISPDIRKYIQIPKTGTKLQRYLLRRSIDTFGPAGQMVVKIGDWSLLPTHGPAGTEKLTLDEISTVLKLLDEGQCVVMTLIYEQVADLVDLAKRIWLNHQVLAYGYTHADQDVYEIFIYDCNFPNQNNAKLVAKREQTGTFNGEPRFGLITQEIIPGLLDKAVRGFFPMPYQPSYPTG